MKQTTIDDLADIIQENTAQLSELTMVIRKLTAQIKELCDTTPSR